MHAPTYFEFSLLYSWLANKVSFFVELGYAVAGTEIGLGDGGTFFFNLNVVTASSETKVGKKLPRSLVYFLQTCQFLDKVQKSVQKVEN